MKVAFHTLGCKVNQYESEAMAKLFAEAGHEIVGEREFADVYVINTCTVTAVADKKSRQYIRRMKKVNPDSIVAVTGCYAQINPEEVAGIKGVDLVTGTNEKRTLPRYVEELAREREIAAWEDGRAAQDQEVSSQEREAAAREHRAAAQEREASAIRVDPADANAGSGPERDGIHVRDWEELDTYEQIGLVTSAENRTRAYIKIQEGCNRFCSYCVIPYARGKIRSRDLGEIIEEAKLLIEAGYKELVLTGINTALYSMEGEACAAGADPAAAPDSDSGQLCGVERVIAALDRLPGDFRIRLSSLEPAVVNAAYVRRLLKYERLCHHLHLSAQSGSDRILPAMNRPYDKKQYLEIVDTVRSFDPYYGISTDLIVGFPGEKEADFRESVQLTAACEFCRTHVFKYSRRPGTLAASMTEQVSPQVKNRRSEILQQAGKEAQTSFCGKNAEQRRRVLFEEYLEESGMLTGFTDNYIRVYVPCEKGTAQPLLNAFREVRLIKSHQDGCIGLIL